MKLLDKMVTKTESYQLLVESVKICAATLEKIAMKMTEIVQTQLIHHQMIMQMWATHQAIMSAMQEKVVDTSMPDLGASTDDKAGKDKPN